MFLKSTAFSDGTFGVLRSTLLEQRVKGGNEVCEGKKVEGKLVI